MIALIREEDCTGCNTCVDVCPTLVLDAGAPVPVIARIDACQTCFLCELYCPTGAIHVGHDQFAPETAADIARHKGVIRADHGWDVPQGALDDYCLLGPLLGEGVAIATRRYDLSRGTNASASGLRVTKAPPAA